MLIVVDEFFCSCLNSDFLQSVIREAILLCGHYDNLIDCRTTIR